MIDNELMKKIANIEDLPISEEILGAYIEGNLSNDESNFAAQVLDSDLCTFNIYCDIINDLFLDESIISEEMIDSLDFPLINDEIITQESVVEDEYSVPECNTFSCDLNFYTDDNFDRDEDIYFNTL